ncbi:hypothetical protein ACP70R_003498 [Stipagrostis hirtigluma subsp. patula]
MGVLGGDGASPARRVSMRMRGAVAGVERCGARPAREADGAGRGVAWRGGAGRRRRGRLLVSRRTR